MDTGHVGMDKTIGIVWQFKGEKKTRIARPQRVVRVETGHMWGWIGLQCIGIAWRFMVRGERRAREETADVHYFCGGTTGRKEKGKQEFGTMWEWSAGRGVGCHRTLQSTCGVWWEMLTDMEGTEE